MIGSHVTNIQSLGGVAQPLSRMLYFPCHAQETATADEIVDHGNISGGLIASPLRIGGTTTNMWANAGYLTLPGDQAFKDATENVREFFRLDNLAQLGGFFISFNFYCTDETPTGVESVFDYSQGSATEGGYGIELTTSGAMRLQYREAGGGSSVNYGATNTIINNARNALAFYIDCFAAVPRVTSYLNGDISGNGNDLPTPLPYLRVARGLRLFSRGSGDSAHDRQLNVGASGARIMDLRFIRFLYDAGPYIPGIAKDAYNNPNEWRLRSLSRK